MFSTVKDILRAVSIHQYFIGVFDICEVGEKHANKYHPIDFNANVVSSNKLFRCTNHGMYSHNSLGCPSIVMFCGCQSMGYTWSQSAQKIRHFCDKLFTPSIKRVLLFRWHHHRSVTGKVSLVNSIPWHMKKNEENDSVFVRRIRLWKIYEAFVVERRFL